MKWEEVKLSDVCVSIYDGTHQAPPKSEDGVPFITISNVDKSNKIDFTDTAFVSKEYYDCVDEKRKARKGDILYTVVGSFGIPVYIKEDIEFVFQRHIAILRPNNKIDGKFLYYTMLSREFYMQADSVALGAAQRTITLNSLRNMAINLPSLEIQQRIVSILSAYDDLIENNQKQIKLLEEAAQRLYKEWFVDLRFPGYEDVEIVDGLPKGWERTAIGKYVSIRSGYAFKSEWWQETGYRVVKIKDISNNTIELSELGYVEPDKTKKASEFKLNKNDIVIAMTGATIGKIGLVPEVDDLYTNQRVGKFFPKECIAKKTGFLFCYYTQSKVLEEILAVSSSSSAQPNISGKQLESFEVVANEEFINKFNGLVEPYLDKINVLRKQMFILKEARDRLLPKLMSGEVEV